MILYLFYDSLWWFLSRNLILLLIFSIGKCNLQQVFRICFSSLKGPDKESYTPKKPRNESFSDDMNNHSVSSMMPSTSNYSPSLDKITASVEEKRAVPTPLPKSAIQPDQLIQALQVKEKIFE